MENKFKFFEHTADIKFQAYGKTINEIFDNSILAFSSYISGSEKIKPKKGKIVEVEGDDIVSLFYNFLDELIFLLDSENFAVAKGNVSIRGNNLKAELFGDDSSNYSLSHIKAATYAEMYVKKISNSEGWEAQAVLDV